jgi:Mg/Co/Ni transporter MgtE
VNSEEIPDSARARPAQTSQRSAGQLRRRVARKGRAADDYPNSTAERLLKSKLVGLWKHRTDIGDSVEFARELRQKAGRRDW